MKCIALLITLILLSAQISAQNKVLSFSILDYQQFSTQQRTNDTDLVIDIKGIRIIPSVGFYMIRRKELLVGCEFGFYPQHTKNIANSAISSSQDGFAELESKSNLFYICPSISNVSAWKQHKIVMAIKLPLQYIAAKSTNYYQEQHYKPSNEIYFQQTHFTKNPNEFIAGIFGTIAFQYRIYNNIFVSPQLGIGFYGSIVRGAILDKSNTNDNGVVTEYITNTETRENNVRFDLQPSLSINLYL